MTTTSLRRPLDQPIAAWLAHQRRPLAAAMILKSGILESLRAFIGQTPGRDLDQRALIIGARCSRIWRHTPPISPTVIRRFCLHRQRKEPGCFVPDPLPSPREPFRRPVIIKPEQIARMLTAGGNMPPRRGSLTTRVYRMA